MVYIDNFSWVWSRSSSTAESCTGLNFSLHAAKVWLECKPQAKPRRFPRGTGWGWWDSGFSTNDEWVHLRIPKWLELWRTPLYMPLHGPHFQRTLEQLKVSGFQWIFRHLSEVTVVVETTINTMKEDLGLNVEGSGSQENEEERMKLQKSQEELVFIAVGIWRKWFVCP